MEKIFDSIIATKITFWGFIVIMAVAFLLGICLAVTTAYKSRYSKSFAITLALIPAVVSLVIIMVNGNLGAGIAVAGAFSLVRFRSSPGTAKEICAIFVASTAGLALGMGYVTYAVIFVVLIAFVFWVLSVTNFGSTSVHTKDKVLKITIPEDLNYSDVFIDVFKKYTTKQQLVKVKTTNMGSMFKLTYQITLVGGISEKEFIDELRCLNGNLEVMLSIEEHSQSEL